MVKNCHYKRKSVSGFTLLELLVVLSIAGLLAAVVPPLYSKVVPGAQLKSAAREFTISLREARSRAITTSSQVDLRLVANPPSYTVSSDSAVQLPRGVFMTAYDYFSAMHESLADSDALVNSDIAIRFFPDGSSNGAIVKVANNSAAYRVDVSWLSGDIKVTEVGNHER